MARRKKVNNTQQELSLFSPEDFLDQVETVLQEAPSPIQQIEEEDTFDRERLVREMKAANEFLRGMDLGKVRLIAMQMTMRYQMGINRGEHYSLQVLPEKDLDWYQFVAMFYTSFSISFPTMMDKLEPELLDCYKEANQSQPSSS